MARKKKSPYAEYDRYDWQWEFLRRNKRYRRAYRAIEWLKRRLDTRLANNRYFKDMITLIGFTYHFSLHRDGGKGYWTYSFSTLATRNLGRFQFTRRPSRIVAMWESGPLGIPSPEADSTEFKEKLLRKCGAVFEYDGPSEPGDWGWTPAHAREIGLIIDTRYPTREILAGVRKVLSTKRPNSRNRCDQYAEYLKVWDLRHRGQSADEIAPKLWPGENATKGGRGPYGDKSALIQRVYDYEKSANELIENVFPAKRRTPRIQK